MAQLVDIAQDMDRQARRSGCSIRDLPRGLRLQLTWVAGNKTLRLSRPAVKPGEEEVSVCRYAFQVPADAERTDGDVTVTLRWPT